MSCNKEENNLNTDERMNIDVGYQLFLKNSNGDNLLDPLNNISFKHSEIKLYEDAKLNIEIQDSLVYKSPDGYFLHLFGGGEKEMSKNDENIKYGTSYLKLNSTTIDTIYSESIYKNEGLVLNKVIYNSILVYNFGDDRAIIIIK